LRVGDTVELVDRTERPANHPLSGDFLRIKAMTENLKTQEVTLEGYRLRRCSYLRPLFDGKLNEVFMLLETSEYDNRPSMVQGRVTVAASEVLKKRECQFANVDYEAYDVSMANKWFLAGIRGSTDIKNYIFDQGTLVCRWAYTIINDHNNVSYGGQVRKLHRCEADDDSETLSPSFSTPQKSAFSPDASSTASASLQRTPSDNSTESKQRNAKRRASVEQLHITPTKRRLSPTKSGRYTFGDVFCGVGGASEGARQAGLHVSWGLELDQHAIKAYAENFPSALPIWENAHDFPAIARRRIHGVDILHLSCPCQFWSVAHTSAGKNDQANIETLLTIGPILKAIKPRYATLEQAPGLLQLKKHRLWFRKLINEITAQKYNVHWTVTDQAIYGLPQRRRRLIFLCAKEGFPLPAFPKAVHGPPNSGLKNWVTVGDALMELKRRGVAADAIDEYHKPEVEKPLKHPREPVDPFSVQAKCITTSGGENTHPSGTRKFTPREFAQLQGFPLDYVFTGSRGNATKQAGNAWAPVANTKYFLLVAQFLEAYDLGLINGEDEIDDL
ncbi:S-adenosyl-L-methionine-dependent methyltransferase, partial [Bimuria novae-zelandiae CBS 107.79]